MRLHKRHAWGAVLILLFVLPVLRPTGVPALEGPAGGFFAWFSEVVPAPRPWSVAEIEEVSDTPRLRERAQELRKREELLLQRIDQLDSLEALKVALARSRLDRVPPVVLARVTRAHDPYPVRRSILIDRGTADGIRVGHPVVRGDVFLGRVRVARRYSSIVQLITDPHSRFEVFVRTTKNELLRGYARRDGSADGHDRLRVDFVRLREGGGHVARGALVLTSNYDERVPAQLIVGRVLDVSDPDIDRMPTLMVRPALDLDRATEVSVLLTSESPPGRAAGTPAPAEAPRPQLQRTVPRKTAADPQRTGG